MGVDWTKVLLAAGGAAGVAAALCYLMKEESEGGVEAERSRVKEAVETKEVEASNEEVLVSNETQVAKQYGWEINLGTWVRYDVDTENLIFEAEAAGNAYVRYSARRQDYVIDIPNRVQINARTGAKREIRQVEVYDEEEDKEGEFIEVPIRSARITHLVDHLLSPTVQVPLPMEASEEPARLSPEEVEKVFVDHVPHVTKILYRDMPGKYSLPMMVDTYEYGLRAFERTPMHLHLLWLFRLIVHHGHAAKLGAARYLQDVAEAFMECQAVQGRVIERVGLEIQGVRGDFHGLVRRLIGDYKSMSLKMLALERIRQRLACDDGNPTHYENRLVADLGQLLGLNMDDIRRASLDEHASSRFPPLAQEDRACAVVRCRQFFDVDAFIKALVAEVNSLREDSPAESLPRQFLEWASRRLSNKHVVFNEDDCTRLDLGEALALAVVEDLFLGQTSAPPEEMFRGTSLQGLFLQH